MQRKALFSMELKFILNLLVLPVNDSDLCLHLLFDYIALEIMILQMKLAVYY